MNKTKFLKDKSTQGLIIKLVVIIGIFFLLKGALKKLFTKKDRVPREVEPNEWKQEPSTLPKSEIYYKNIADKLYQLMKHIGVTGWDEQYKLLVLLTPQERQQVYAEYGLKSYYNVFGITSEPMDLGEWWQEELKESEMTQARWLYRDTLIKF